MPLLIEPVKELKSIEIQPSLQKVENSAVSGTELAFIILLILVAYILKEPILAFIKFLVKLAIVSVCVYLFYILYLQ